MKAQRTRKTEAISLFEVDNLSSQGFFTTQPVKLMYIPDTEIGNNISAPLPRDRIDQLKVLPSTPISNRRSRFAMRRSRVIWQKA